MTDIALQLIDAGIGVPPLLDLAIDGSDLATDDGLRTAVIISLFTDRRADTDDEIPDGTGDRRGWWADAYADIEGDLVGSRLWLLSREKQMSSVLIRAREYAEESLQWLIDDGIAVAVKAEAEVVRQGVLGLHIAISRPNGALAEYRFNHLWEAV